MPCHVIVHFSKVLGISISVARSTLRTPNEVPLTETKKLDVPSARENVSGNSFSQVSSPYITSFPPGLAFSCASQVSWCAKLEVASDSAKFNMTSRKEGIDPVVIALSRGIVMVGDVAWAVKGSAAPDLMRLWSTIRYRLQHDGFQYIPLGELEA